MSAASQVNALRPLGVLLGGPFAPQRSIEPKPLIRDTTNMRRPVYGPKIPVRPLHKRPFYQRIFFYLSRIFRKTT